MLEAFVVVLFFLTICGIFSLNMSTFLFFQLLQGILMKSIVVQEYIIPVTSKTYEITCSTEFKILDIILAGGYIIISCENIPNPITEKTVTITLVETSEKVPNKSFYIGTVYQEQYRPIHLYQSIDPKQVLTYKFQ